MRLPSVGKVLVELCSDAAPASASARAPPADRDRRHRALERVRGEDATTLGHAERARAEDAGAAKHGSRASAWSPAGSRIAALGVSWEHTFLDGEDLTTIKFGARVAFDLDL